MAKKDIGFSTLESIVNYSGADYSPNNIRRLIISPEGVGVYFYVGKPAIFKSFSMLDYINSTRQADFKPMLKNLYSGRQLTSVEEIVILTTGSNGQEILHPDEYSVQTIVGKRGATSFEGCRNSYKRLRYITILRNVTFANFRNYIHGINNLEFVSELAGIKDNAEISEVWGTEYYTQNGISIKSREMYPLMDGAGGKLVKYFETVKTEKDKAFKLTEISKLKEQATKGLRADFDKVYKDYSYAFICNNRLCNIIKKQGFNALATKDTCIVGIRAELKKFSGLNTSLKNISIIECNNDKEALEYNIRVLKECIQKIYLNIAKDLFTKVANLGVSKPFTAKVIMDSCDCVVAPKGSELIALNEQIASKTGKSFKGESVLDSIANACAYICKYFVSNYGSTDISKYYEKQAWIGGR